MKTIFAFSMLMIMSSAFASEKNTYELTCSGIEPFWTLKIEREVITYKSPDHLKGLKYYKATKTEALGTNDGKAFKVEAFSKDSKRVSLALLDAGVSCEDGVYEGIYKYHVLAEINGKTFFGCCR